MFVNRSAIILAPKKPSIDWANSRDAAGPRFVETWQDEGPTVFLGPECVTNEETKQFVEENFDLFFEHYLDLWSTDETLWPKNRTLQMFRDWFTIRIHSMVLDTVDQPLRLE